MKAVHSLGLAETDYWHVLSAEEAVERLGVEPQAGLSLGEPDRRAAEYGPNEIREHRARSLWRMFLDQFTDFMILVLIAAAIVSGIIGEPVDTIAILIIVLLNGLLGFVQEYRAERAVAAPPPNVTATLLGRPRLPDRLIAAWLGWRVERKSGLLSCLHIPPGDLLVFTDWLTTRAQERWRVISSMALLKCTPDLVSQWSRRRGGPWFSSILGQVEGRLGHWMALGLVFLFLVAMFFALFTGAKLP